KREALKRELLAQTRAECEATNKALQEQLEKQEKQNLELVQELQQAKDENDLGKITKIMSMMKDNDKN
ncbi:22143_t:CDS:1, partial [Dentiscutata erythropus]